jgi:uncharacterized protein YbbC (DUF1343 family)
MIELRSKKQETRTWNWKWRVFINASVICSLLLLASMADAQAVDPNIPPYTSNGHKITPGAERLHGLLALLHDKKVALMVNQTSTVGETPLVDTLLAYGINIKKIFAPEHGFRGKADAGESLNDSIDAKTGLPVISVYGKKKKPTADDLADVDIVVFDIQDVGARFYTFISSLHYLMEACAENNKKLIVLDRPNPNGWYVEGPVLKKEFQSFVGLDPVPVVYGLTIGEYAQMINGEKWLPDGMQCTLMIIPCQNYDHTDQFSLPIKPSPNLPNAAAIALYPYLCFFEGTNVSVGRGTDLPFQVIGSPKTKFDGAYEFTPQSKPGAKEPPFLKQKCYGYALSPSNQKSSFHYVLQMYKLYADRDDFFLKNNFFDKLAGTGEIRKMIIAGKTEDEIKASYSKDLEAFKLIRKKYLLYKDFE